MTDLSDLIASCDQILRMSKDVKSKELRDEIEVRIGAQKQALEALRKMLN
jgi:hypothetical protein